jgi:hypothetical protein
MTDNNKATSLHDIIYFGRKSLMIQASGAYLESRTKVQLPVQNYLPIIVKLCFEEIGKSKYWIHQKMIYISRYIIFQTTFAGQGGPSKNPIVWLDGARHANTCILFSFPRNVSTQPFGFPNPKNKFASK